MPYEVWNGDEATCCNHMWWCGNIDQTRLQNCHIWCEQPHVAEPLSSICARITGQESTLCHRNINRICSFSIYVACIEDSKILNKVWAIEYINIMVLSTSPPQHLSHGSVSHPWALVYVPWYSLIYILSFIKVLDAWDTIKHISPGNTLSHPLFPP